MKATIESGLVNSPSPSRPQVLILVIMTSIHVYLPRLFPCHPVDCNYTVNENSTHFYDADTNECLPNEPNNSKVNGVCKAWGKNREPLEAAMLPNHLLQIQILA